MSVQTLAVNGTPVYESAICIQLLDEMYPDKGLALLPKDPLARAHARMWCDHVDKSIVPHVYSLLLARGDPEACKESLTKGLLAWANAFVGDGPFFAGSQPAMPDIMLAPFALRFNSPLLKDMLGGYALPAPDDVPSKRLAEWSRAIAAHDAVQATMSDEAEVLKMYKSYKEARAGT